MEIIVALEVGLANGDSTHFMTWGRVQDVVEPESVERVVLTYAQLVGLPAKAVKARLCRSLQEASHQPFFYECFFLMCQMRVPYGPDFDAWKAARAAAMKEGREIYWLG